MNTLTHSSSIASLWASDHRIQTMKGMFYREWFLLRNFYSIMVGIWILCLLSLRIFEHPTWSLLYGVMFAKVAMTLGGRDAMEGCEEFTLSLPPTRSERYFARYLFGAVPLLFLTTLGSLSLAWNLPPKLWRLFVESGFTASYNDASDHRWLFLWSVSIPFALYTCAYSYASMSSRGGSPSSSGAWWLSLFTVAGMAAVFGAIELVGIPRPFHKIPSLTSPTLFSVPIASLARFMSGVLSTFCIIASSLAIGYGGWRVYLRKDAAAAANLQEHHSKAILLIIVVAVLLLLSVGLMAFRVHVANG